MTPPRPKDEAPESLSELVARLAPLAAAATPGRRSTKPGCDLTAVMDDVGCVLGYAVARRDLGASDAALIAALDPQTVQRLLDAVGERDRMEEFIARWQRLASGEDEAFADDTHAMENLDIEARAILSPPPTGG